MSIITDIESEAVELANTRLSFVLKVAFGRDHMFCDNCDYPQNSEMYDIYLSHYATACRLRHREGKILDNHPSNRYHLGSFSEDMRRYNEYNEDAYYWKRLISPISPCPDCKKKYNPTSRMKYGSAGKPQQKDFLDYE